VNPEPLDRYVQKNPAAMKGEILDSCLKTNKGQRDQKYRFFNDFRTRTSAQVIRSPQNRQNASFPVSADHSGPNVACFLTRYSTEKQYYLKPQDCQQTVFVFPSYQLQFHSLVNPKSNANPSNRTSSSRR
jgi:hypothetical protein